MTLWGIAKNNLKLKARWLQNMHVCDLGIAIPCVKGCGGRASRARGHDRLNVSCVASQRVNNSFAEPWATGILQGHRGHPEAESLLISKHARSGDQQSFG